MRVTKKDKDAKNIKSKIMIKFLIENASFDQNVIRAKYF
jgi:hypothetical protein